MAQIGVKYPMYAPLIEDETSKTFEYGEGKIAGKAIRINWNLNIAESKLYADDDVAESAKEFIDGTLGFNPDDIPQDARADWLDNKIEKETVGAEEVDVLTSTDEDNPGYFGFGFIVTKIKNNQRLYRAILLTKVQFKEPNEETETKGQQITWQTPNIEGTIMRRIDGAWKKEITVSSLTTAKAWLAQVLNIGGSDT